MGMMHDEDYEISTYNGGAYRCFFFLLLLTKVLIIARQV